MLARNGPLVLHLSLVVAGTKCPASTFQASASSSVTLPDGSTYRKWRAVRQLKVAPPGMWLACRAQIQQLAAQCHLRVVSMTDFAPGNEHLCNGYQDISDTLVEFYRGDRGQTPYSATNHVY